MIQKLLLSSALACLSAGAFAVCNVAPPTVTDNVNTCATSFDINPATGKPYFPSSELSYTLMAEPANAIDEILWYLSNDLKIVYNIGSKIAILENDFQVLVIPGSESSLYAVSKHTNGTEVCYSEPVKAIIKPKPTPIKPSLINNGHNFAVYQDDTYNYGSINLRTSHNGRIEIYDNNAYKQSIAHGTVPSCLTVTGDGQTSIESFMPGNNDLNNVSFVAIEIFDGCVSDTTIFEFTEFPSFKIDQVLSPNDVAYETVYIEQLKLKSLLIEAELLKQLLETTMPTIINDSLVVWYYKPANVLKADASWTVAGYGPNFVPHQYGTYMAEIHNTKGELVAVTKQYTVALGTPVAELAPAELTITYSAGEISLSQPAHIAVYSSAGTCVAQGTGTSLTLPQLPAGVYIAKASTASASAELVITIQ